MNNTRILIVLCFAVAFGAGLVAGKLWERTANAATPPPQVPDVSVLVGGEPPVVTSPVVTSPVPSTSQTSTPPIVPQPASPKPVDWLKDLDLTPEQNKQMAEIWKDAMDKRPKFGHDRFATLRKERDDAIKAALTDEQRTKQKEMNSARDAKNFELERKLRAEQDNVRKQTEEAFAQLLNDEQKAKIDAAKKSYESKVEDAMKENEWKRTYDDAVAKTRQMLTAEQRIKYDEMRKNPRHGFGGPRPPSGRGPGDRGPGDRGPGDRGPGDRPNGKGPGDKPPGDGPRGDAKDGAGKPLIKPKNGFVLEKVGGSRARVSCPPCATFHA